MEINKFKVYDKELSKMYDHNEIATVTFRNHDGQQWCMSVYCSYDPIMIHNHERFTVLRYSGFKDSDGNEIYDKDLLKCDDSPDSWYEVFYCEMGGVWEVLDFKNDGTGGPSESLANIVCDVDGYAHVKIFGNDLTYNYPPKSKEEGEDGQV